MMSDTAPITPELAFDHVVVTCHKLKAGVDYVRRIFGVEIPLGGQHDFMGTHNAVMAVGDGIYFEVIAIDTSMPVPPYPRWFGLGNPKFEDRMKDQPILAHYVLRTPDMEATMAGLSDELKEKLGPVHAASRGDLSWKITINPTGLPPEGGCLPSLIEWDGTPPQYKMARPGPELERINLCHPNPEALLADLKMMGAGALMNAGMIDAQETAKTGLKADFTQNNKAVWI